MENMPAEEAVMIEETEDLRQAAEQSQRENVLVELTLDNVIKWVSSSWQDVIGYFLLFVPPRCALLICCIEAILRMLLGILSQKFLSAINVYSIKRQILSLRMTHIVYAYDLWWQWVKRFKVRR